MMEEIGVRELKERTSEIVRRVRESQEPIIITHRGRAVARIVPFERSNWRRAEARSVWAEMDELAGEIGGSWPGDGPAADAVLEQRRVL